MRKVLELPVTMSFERDGGAAVGHALAAFGAAQRLVQPGSCSLRVDDIGSWHLYREDGDEPDGTGPAASSAGEDDDLDDLDDLDDDHDADVRAVDRIDPSVVAALLGEALGPHAAEQSWRLSLEGGGGWPDPFLVRIEAQPEGIALHIEVRWSTWTEPGSAGRADVEQLGRDLVQQGWRRMELDGWSHTDPTASTGRADARILDEPVEVDLHWNGTAADGELEKAGLVISAIAALAPILRPRELMMITCLAGRPEAGSSEESRTSLWWLREDAGGPSRWNWGMRIRGSVSVDREAMLGFAREALAPRRPAGLLGWARGKRAVSWSSLDASDALVRVPDAARFAGRSSLCVLAGQREISLPLVRRDDGLWVSLMPDGHGEDQLEDEPAGEDLDIAGPISVWARAEGPTLQIRLHWSLWAYPGSAGRVLVDRALAALIRLGWQRTTDP